MRSKKSWLANKHERTHIDFLADTHALRKRKKKKEGKKVIHLELFDFCIHVCMF